MNLLFGTYTLDTTNGVYTKGFHEMHGAERSLTLLKGFRSRGVLVLSSVFQGKVLELTGTIIADDSTELITLVRNFVREMSRDGQPLTYTNDLATYVYEGCYVTNTDSMITMREYDNQHWAEFRVLMLAPKGFAHDTELLTTEADNITTLPYSGTIDILGDTSPEPIITITLVDASTIKDVYFTNLTTNQQISVTEVTFVDGDILSFDTENKQVLHNSTPINFNGVFPDFIPGDNDYQITAAGGAANEVLTQDQYNSEVSVYGATRAAQSFQVSGTPSISQLALLLKKVEVPLYTAESWDNMNDGTVDTNKWGVTGTSGGTATESSGYMRFTATAPGDVVASTAGKTGGSGWAGVKFFFSENTGNLNGGDARCVLTTNIGELLVAIDPGADSGQIVGTGSFAAVNITIPGASVGTWDIRPVSGNIEIYFNDILKTTVNSVNPVSTSFECYIAAGGAELTVLLDDVVKYVPTSSTVNSDLTVHIQTNSAGAPSGTPVTNATLTIPKESIGTSFAQIISDFATEPTLSAATTYHVVVYQAGGDINNYYVLKKQNTNVLANGNLETSINSGGSYTQVTGEDMYLKIWSSLPTGFDLDVDISYFASYMNIV